MVFVLLVGAAAAVALLGAELGVSAAAAFGGLVRLAVVVHVIAVVAAMVAFAARSFGQLVHALLLHDCPMHVGVGGGIAAVVGHLGLRAVVFVRVSFIFSSHR